MITRDQLPYFVVYVKDHNSAAEFFTKNLGMRVGTSPITEPSSRLAGHATALALYGTTLLLIDQDGKDNIPEVQAGHGYPCFEVEDLSSFHANAVKNHVEVVQPPFHDELGRVAAYRGPDGLIVMALQSNQKAESHGIVLSGGGAYGAFELGVLRKLAAAASTDHRGLNNFTPSVVTGTSVGAFNAAWLVCALADRSKSMTEIVEGLVGVWRNRIAGGVHDNGAFRLRGDLLSFPGVREIIQDTAFLAGDLLKRLAYVSALPPEISRLLEAVDISALVSAQPLRDLVNDTLSWQALENSPCRLQVAATDWEAGQVRLFGHGSCLLEGEEQMLESNFRDAVMASTAIPGFFPPVAVEAGKPGGGRELRICVDGGLVLNSPLNPAIDAGATSIHLICLNPDVSTLTLSPVNSTLDTLERALATSVASGVASELARVKLGNRLAGVVRHENSNEFFRAVTVHRYHPSKRVLGGVPGILDFSLQHLDELIGNGEFVAANHDCEREKCVLPKNHLSGRSNPK